MASRASIAGHPIHPMLVVFPIGLFVFSFISDLIYLGTHNDVWRDVAYYTMVGGLIGALAAAVPGLIDFFSISNNATRRIGAAHMVINIGVVILYVVNVWLRRTPTAPTLSIWLSGLSVALLAVSGWLGGEMVYRHGVGVDPTGTGAETAPNPRLRPSPSRR